MRSEAELCTIVKHSLDNCAKIPDPSNGFSSTSIRTFDGIGTINKSDGLHFVCWEAKFLKSMQAFAFSRIEPHQNFYLTKYAECIGVISYVIVGINAGRADQRAYIFLWDDFMSQLYLNKFSIHKKFLEKLPYNEIHKGKFDFNKIIDKKVLSDIYGNIEKVLEDLKGINVGNT